MNRDKELSEIDEIIKKLCNDKKIEEKEIELLKKYLESCNNFIWDLKRQQRRWKASGINYEELSDDGWAKDSIVSVGPEKWLELRAEMINKWKNDLEKIKAKLRAFGKRN